jgi:hypothetical protein
VRKHKQPHSNTENNKKRKPENRKTEIKKLADTSVMAKKKKKLKKETKKDAEQVMEEDKAYSTRELEEDFS